MKLALLLFQATLLGAVWFSSLTAETLLILYGVDFIVVAAYFRSCLRGGNWFLNQGFVFLLIYTIYYPMTAALVLGSGIDLLPMDFVVSQLRYAVLCITAFTLAYVSISKLYRLNKVRPEHAQEFSRQFSYVVLVPAMLLSPLYRLAITGWGAGFSAEYVARYAGMARLVESGQGIYLQIANQLTPISFAALALFFSKEVERRRYGYVAMALGFYLWYSILTGARTGFLAPALLFLVVFAKSYPIRFDVKRWAMFAAVLVFYFGLERARSVEVEGSVDTVLIGEAFVVFTNGLVFADESGMNLSRPPINTYLNDLTKFWPGYIYQSGQDNARWYIMEAFPEAYEAGHGRAFGFHAEAMVNFGEWSIVLQALVLGVVFAILTGAVLPRFQRSTYIALFNVILLANTYLLVRVSTFAFIASLVPLAIALLLIRVTQGVLAHACRSAEAYADAASYPLGMPGSPLRQTGPRTSPHAP